MKICAVGDPHYKTGNRDETTEMEVKLYNYLVDNPVDLIVIMGDVFDRHETIHVSPLTRVKNWIKSLRSLAPVVILVGNHDRKNNRDYLGPEHSLVCFEGWDNVTIVATPVRQQYGDHILVFAPYVPPGRFEECLDTIEWRDASMIFSHQEFKGLQMGNKISTEGDEWPHDIVVANGHIHQYQEVGSVICIGTAYCQSYGDNGLKTISIFELGSDFLDHTRIPLKCTRKRVVTITEEEIPTFKLPTNCKCKIKIKGPTSVLKHPIVTRWKARGHVVVAIPVINNTVTVGNLPTGQSFSCLLMNKLRGEPEEIIELYHSIYGQ